MKIFTHLRNDWFRYGFETLAVVVGILIAFALDNWNESRKDSILEEYYLLRLVDDLKADIAEIDSTVKYASNYIAVGNELLAYLGTDISEDIDESTDIRTVDFLNAALEQNHLNIANEDFGRSLGFLFDERVVDMYNYTYNELISTGKFEVINNPDIRKNLTNYYLNFAAILDVQDNLLFAIDEYNKALKENNIPILNSLSFEELRGQFNTDNGKELQTALVNLIWNHAYSISPFQERYRPLCLELINEIEDYLITL